MSIQQEKFTDIANKIREKTNSSEKIKPDDFAKKIDEVYKAGQNSVYDSENIVQAQESGTVFTISDVSEIKHKILVTPQASDTEIRITGKNLYNPQNTLIGYFTRAITSVTTHANARTLFMKCLPNTTYTITKTVISNNFHIGYTNETPAVGVTVYNAKTLDATDTVTTITTGPDAKYIIAYIYNGYDVADRDRLDAILSGIQIEYGNNSTSYEKHFCSFEGTISDSVEIDSVCPQMLFTASSEVSVKYRKYPGFSK